MAEPDRSRRPSKRMAWLAPVLALVVAALGIWLTGGSDDPADPSSSPTSSSQASASGRTSPVDPVSGLGWVAVADLPAEARDTLDRVESGGPFRYRCCDDVVFRNDEGRLPDEPRGYYREYTVTTPGSSDRGPRRIVAGDGDERYYTDDHYASFERIRR